MNTNEKIHQAFNNRETVEIENIFKPNTMKQSITKQQIHLFLSLKEQYESKRPMTESEEFTMWDIQSKLWQQNGGKFRTGMRIKTK